MQKKIKALKRSGCSAVFVLLALAVSGCTNEAARDVLSEGVLPPVVNPVTETNQTLRELPPPSNKVVVAVYDYADQTGQFKPKENTQTLSKAVTQGATSILIKALQDVSDGQWFTVVEREKVNNLLKERNIITQMRKVYLGEKKINAEALPPLLFAGIIFEGGIIGFDSNVQTGGIGARLLGIGGDVKYRLNTITIYLRAVSTKTGQVLASVTTHKSIASIGLQGGVFKYIAVDKILEAEAGITKNEPDQLAVQQAIEKAVYAMVIEGAEKKIWRFADEEAEAELIGAYHTGIEQQEMGRRRIGPVAQAGKAGLETVSSIKAAKAPEAIEPAVQDAADATRHTKEGGEAADPADASQGWIGATADVAPMPSPGAREIAPSKAPTPVSGWTGTTASIPPTPVPAQRMQGNATTPARDPGSGDPVSATTARQPKLPVGWRPSLSHAAVSAARSVTSAMPSRRPWLSEVAMAEHASDRERPSQR